jgi:hypothetical protein
MPVSPIRRAPPPTASAHCCFWTRALIVADVILANATSPLIVFAGAALWGLHMAFTQGLLSKLVADTAPAELRGTAFGIFNLVSGGALLQQHDRRLLWSEFGASATFVASAVFAAVAAAGLLATIRTSSHSSRRPLAGSEPHFRNSSETGRPEFHHEFPDGSRDGLSHTRVQLVSGFASGMFAAAFAVRLAPKPPAGHCSARPGTAGAVGRVSPVSSRSNSSDR